MFVLNTSPRPLQKIKASLQGLNALPSERNGSHWKKFFSFKKQKKTRLQTFDEALGSQPGWRRCSRCGWCLHKHVNHIGMGQPPDSEGAENSLFFTNLRLACMGQTWISQQGKEGTGTPYLLRFIMSKHCYVFYSHYRSSSQQFYGVELLLFITHTHTYFIDGENETQRG